jgi:hypothetical protein
MRRHQFIYRGLRAEAKSGTEAVQATKERRSLAAAAAEFWIEAASLEWIRQRLAVDPHIVCVTGVDQPHFYVLLL